jgi:Na+-transporting methylmalonyl-CoA/oxaloacetate decarboxylase gamma subunit
MFSDKIISVYSQAIDISFKGMTALFLFMFIFFILIMQLTNFFPHKEEPKK